MSWLSRKVSVIFRYSKREVNSPRWTLQIHKMPCCRESNSVEVEDCGIAPSNKRKCHDILCCVLFLLYWVGMIVIAIIGLKNGNPTSLIYGSDYEGNTCGDGDFSSKKYLFYPRLGDDLLYAVKEKIPPTDMSFYGICVNACPQPNDSGPTTQICNNDDSSCWNVVLPTQSTFFRCVPMSTQNETIEYEFCKDPLDAQANCSVAAYTSGKCTKICKVKMQKITLFETSETQENPILSQIQGHAQQAVRWMADIQQTIPVILLVGGAGSFIFGLVFLIMLLYCAGCMVWITCLTVLAVLILLSLYASVKGKVISSIAFFESTFEVSSKDQDNFAICAYILWFITVCTFVLILALTSRIRIAVAIIREASRCIKAIPCLLLWPFVPAISIVVLIFYWMTIAAYIMSSDITAKTLATSTGGNLNMTVTGLGQLDNSHLSTILFLYHFFGLLWTNQVIQAISMCTIAGSVSCYYWSRPSPSGNRDVGRFPIAAAARRTFRYHLGSLCFGALVIAIVQFIRAILMYIDQQTHDLQNSNKLIKVLMKCVQCCLWCFEKCLKFLSKNAYIVIAMKGNSFCSASKDSFFLILSNFARIAIVNSISFFVLLLATICISGAMGTVMFYILTTSSIYQSGGSKEVSTPLFPVLVTIMFSWFTTKTFMSVLEMAIDTILLCFCEDCKVNEQGNVFMSDELAKIVGKPKPPHHDGSNSHGKTITIQSKKE